LIISSLKRYFFLLFNKVVDASHEEKFSTRRSRIFIMLSGKIKTNKKKNIENSDAVPILLVFFCLDVGSSVDQEETAT